jgi:hypothetical protein
VKLVLLSSSDVAPALPGYFPWPPGADVRVGVRAEWAKVGGPEVVVADQLELVLLRPVRAHGAAGRLADGPAGLPALPVFWLAGHGVIDVFVPGPRMRVISCRLLAHDDPPLPAVGRAGSGYLPGPTAP